MTKKNYNPLDYLFVFILIIYAASATNFARSLNTWEVLESLFFIICFTLYYAYRNTTIFSKNFYYVLSGFTFYFILLTIKFKELHPRFWGIYIISFIITYVCITNLKHQFFIIYEEILYYLSSIALFFWIIYQVFPSGLTNLIDTIAFYKAGSDNVKSNIIIYTINNARFIGEAYNINLGFFSFSRNPGFAWEPGAFAVFICLAVYVHIIKSKFKNIFNKRFWLYLVCLLSTFSTTGFSVFFAIIGFYLYNIEIKYKQFYFICLFSIGLGLFSTDIVTDKMNQVVTQNTEEQIENSVKYGTSYTPQRYTSFLIDFQDFLNNPILGYGGHEEERWTMKLGAQIGSISGIGKLLARFGSIGSIFFFVLLINGSKKLALLFQYRGWGFLVVIFLMISLSYSLLEHPLLMSFWMFAFFTPAISSKFLNIKNKIL